MSLVPPDLDELVRAAVEVFWKSRATGSNAQGGTRGNVISGKNMDGFISVVEAIAKHCGLPQECVFGRDRGRLAIPGYFRPAKRWDALIIYRHRLLAVLEFKSQVGSISNNYNNRSEEVIGLAKDLQFARRNGLFLPGRHVASEASVGGDPRPPFSAYLLLLEDTDSSTRAIRVEEPHYPVDPIFDGSSYAERYRILCERLMLEGMYNAASLLLSPVDEQGLHGAWRHLSAATDPRSLFSGLAAHLHSATEEAARQQRDLSS